MSSYTTILGFDPSTAQLYQLWLGAKTCLLGLTEEIPSDSQNRDLLHILLYSRSEMYPGYRWINEEIMKSVLVCFALKEFDKNKLEKLLITL